MNDTRQRRLNKENARARAQARLIKVHPEARRMSRKALALRYHDEWKTVYQEELRGSGLAS